MSHFASRDLARREQWHPSMKTMTTTRRPRCPKCGRFVKTICHTCIIGRVTAEVEAERLAAPVARRGWLADAEMTPTYYAITRVVRLAAPFLALLGLACN